MARRLPRPVDYRAVYVRTQVPELLDSIEGDAISGAFVASLTEAPADPTQPATPMVVTIGGAPRTRVDGAPAAGQFRVWTAIIGGATEWLPVLEFHSSDAGQNPSVDYYRGGSVYHRLWMERLREYARPLMYGSLAALQGSHPATADAWTRGGPADLAIVAGALYYSDGAAWQLLSGGSPVGASAGVGPAASPVILPGLTGSGGAAGGVGPAAAPVTAQAPAVTIGAPPGGASGEAGPISAPVVPGVLGAVGAAASGAGPASSPVAAQGLGAVGGGGGASIVSDFEAGLDGWTLGGALARSAVGPIAGAYSLRVAGAGTSSGLSASKTVTSLRSGITSVAFKYKATQVFPGTSTPGGGAYGDGISVIANAGVSGVGANLIVDGAEHTLTLNPPGGASAGPVAISIFVVDGVDGEDLLLEYVVTIDDVTINGVSA